MMIPTFLKELVELRRDGRIRIAYAVVFLLMGVSIWISARQYRQVNDEYAAARNAERAIWDGQGSKNPHSAAHFGTYAFKPKYPLSLLDQGVDKFAGTSIFLEAHRRNEAQFSAAADQTGLARFGDLTPDFILLFIIPLLIILLGYNSITRERELGTLTLLKSQGSGMMGWLMGKWLGLFLPILLLTAVLFCIAGILLANLQDYGTLDIGALFVLFLVYAAYYAVFTNLVLLISAMSRKSGVSMVLSLSLWVLACLAIPKAASNLADRKYPYPTRQEFAARVQADKAQGLNGHNPWSTEAIRLQDSVLKAHGVDSLQQLPFNFDGFIMQEGEEHEAEIYFKHYEFLRSRYREQSALYRAMALLSPYLPARFLSMAVANTDYAAHWEFSDAAEQYRIMAQEFLNDHFAESSRYGDWAYQADPEFWSELPDFEFQTPTVGRTLSRNASSLLILGLWVLASTGFLLITSKNI